MRHIYILTAVLAAVLVGQGARAQKLSAAAASSAQAAAASAQYVGSETCATCHEEVAKGFANNPHTKIALEHGKSGVTCEGCHGPGSEHVASGGSTKIFNPADASSKEVDARCQTCHAGDHPNFDRSPHAKANVSCISCHDIHQSKDEETLLKAPQPRLCYQCHADTKAAFNMPFHHPVNEGTVTCSDCHDVHGSFGDNNLRSTADQNAICTKCHADTRGPFVYEHLVVKGEGCMACHTPHGTQNARLLNMPNINELCEQCHNALAQGAVHGISNGTLVMSPCTSCHSQIHGSNTHFAFEN